MAVGTYEITHDKILESGKKLFLENGYERTNLRAICKGAGITTGAFYRHFDGKEALFSALVDPLINSIEHKFKNATNLCLDELSNGKLAALDYVSEEAIFETIDFIFDNFDLFKLLIDCSDGTKYSNFVDFIVDLELDSMERVSILLRKNNIKINDVNNNDLHIIYHSYYSCLFEIVLHDYSKDEAIRCAKTIFDFFMAGFHKVLGLS
ncbi:TetR/AcrR family transcriptional regulator [Peptacetobacter sp.]|uniref:TetR/AcrR family transcriptional regulator n=1 Tax=Peptacetobacter sp. TaxID=2991975 RepID=UPI0026317A84|nr:TetR/AcrR family transcriptional regulator [Peptacetobacter sp.]